LDLVPFQIYDWFPHIASKLAKSSIRHDGLTAAECSCSKNLGDGATEPAIRNLKQTFDLLTSFSKARSFKSLKALFAPQAAKSGSEPKVANSFFVLRALAT